MPRRLSTSHAPQPSIVSLLHATRGRLRAIIASGLLLALGSGGASADPLVRMRTDFGDFFLNLTPERAPLTVENFLSYVDSGAYDNMFFHRNPTPRFVLQGGEFVWPPGAADFSSIPEDSPVQNEFNVSNLRGTVAMAKLGGDPNSATNNFFVNLVDNSANLDNQNGGFTVFATIDDAGMAVIDTISNLPTTQDIPVTTFAGATPTRSTVVLVDNAETFQRIAAPASAVLPASRSVAVNSGATGFATIVNSSANEAASCTMAPTTSVAADFFYRRTNPANNQPFGINNPVIDIEPQGSASVLFTFTPTQAFANTTIEFAFNCGNASGPATLFPGVNTFDLASSSTPVADVVALAGTTSADGINSIDRGVGSGAFVVATFNLGAQEDITVTADTGGTSLPIGLFVCPTVPETGVCQDGQGPAVSYTATVDANETGTFAVFAQLIDNNDTIDFDPAGNRAFVRFRSASGELRGSTSVALRTVGGM